VLVIDEDGLFSGGPGTILERFENVSVASDAKKENGATNYYKTIINTSSRYIIADNLDNIITGADDSIADGTLSFASTFTGGGSIYQVSLTGGVSANSKDGVVEALDQFTDAETLDLNLLFAENDTNNSTTIANKLIQVAEGRKDCVAFISPDLEVKDQATEDAKLDKVLTKFNKLVSTSYAVFDSSPLYVYNKYADEYIWIPASGSMAGLCARTDNTRDPWFSPAGYNRGQLLGVAKLGFNPKQNARDELYKARVNPVVSFPGQGILLFGDKTGLARPSAFDRINVRRLFIVLEKAIATASKFSLFELNDEFTRAQFRNLVEPFLRDVQGRRGITDFLVVCDETNNTGEVIDTNRFVADIYIKPARSINFITLNFVATRTGVEFSEVVGQF
jgi:phage tail sheath protein FI